MKITKFHISNYRSLVDFKIDEFDSTTVFYGLNNAGKSNVLNALELIFKKKIQFDKDHFTEPKNFYEGFIKNFTNSFYNNDDNLTIDFYVEISVKKAELDIDGVIEPLFDNWPAELILSVKGSIKKAASDVGVAEMITDEIKLDNEVIYNPAVSGFYFPKLQAKNQNNLSELSTGFSKLIHRFNDCVYIIGSGRDMHPTIFNNEDTVEMTPSSFKRFLYKLYLSENEHHLFEKINEVFAAEPFGFGDLTFSKIDGHLEIMIKEKERNIRLPIKHLGSGVLQILYIVAGVVCNRSRIVCIEELEQNLSPKLQNQALRKIQSMLGYLLDQIIISSHSSVFAKSKLSGAIYVIKKADGKTYVAEKIGDSFGKEAKEHFIHGALPQKTYTDEEITSYLDSETRALVEDRFSH